MSVLSVAVKHLVALGMAGDALVAAIAEMEAEIDTRSVGAKRQARYRERNEASQIVTSDADVTPLPALNKSPQTPKINPTPLVHTHETRTRGSTWPCPEGVNPTHWSDFLANRKRKRLVNTQTAFDGVLSDLTDLANDEWPPGKLVQLAAAKGWGSINKPDGYQNGRSNGHRMGGFGEPQARSLGAAVDFLADVRHQ